MTPELTSAVAHGIRWVPMSPSRWTRVAAGIATACFAFAGPAAAQPNDAHATAASLLAQLEGDTHAPLVADPVAQAKTALERATRMRATGDEVHARAADELALEWAQMARDLVKAAEAEATAAEARKKAVDAQAQLERTRAAVEEGIARVGRLKAELAEAEAANRDKRTAVEVHEGEPVPPKKGEAPRKKRVVKKGPAGSAPAGDAP
jgi:hypothetical protein